MGTITRGKRFVKADMIEAGTPCIHYGEIYTKYGVSADAAYSFVDPELAARLRKACKGDVVIVSAGETVEDIGKGVAWLGDEEVVIHDACYAYRSNLEPKYVSYFLRTEDFRNQVRKYISSSKVSSISTENLGRVRIAVPPIEVQSEIVRILDLFTTLEAELEAELEARKKQYEHYRDSLLSFDMLRAGVEWSSLDDLLAYEQPGKYLVASAEYSDQHPTPVLTAGQSFVLGYTSETDGIYPASKEAPVIIFDDFTTAFKWVEFPFKAKSSAMKMITVKDQDVASLRYVYYTMQTIRYKPQEHARQWIGTYSAFLVPLPSREEQDRIVAILDRFDALVNDLSVGLPAELAARRAQYEHYRDRLLTFDEAAA